MLMLCMADYRISDSPSSQGVAELSSKAGEERGVTSDPVESSPAPLPPAREITVLEFNYSPLIY